MSRFSISRRVVLKVGALAAASLIRRPPVYSKPDELTEHGLRRVPNSNATYYLIPYDDNGEERGWDDGTRVSRNVLHVLANEPITDVFIFSHGWRGDYGEAIRQYDLWVGEMAKCGDDTAAIRRVRQDFRPLLVGLHWPSLPLGDETIRAAAVQAEVSREEINEVAKHIVDTPKARAAIKKILQADRDPPAGDLPRSIAQAFVDLQIEAGMRSRGPGASPGNDSELFDPTALYADLQQREFRNPTGDEEIREFGGASAIRSMLELQSFWRMKKLACTFGETGAHALLAAMQRTAGTKRRVRFHLMGHSFGCIVASACIAGPKQRVALPVNSLCLVQGAFSIWSYCSDFASGIAGRSVALPGATPGYFHRILAKRLVDGPIVTTQSKHDTAVCRIYPWAAWWGGPEYYAMNEERCPEYAAVGDYGLQGPGVNGINRNIGSANTDYAFMSHKVYNVDCSQVICKDEGIAGAHSDLCHAEVAHLVWQAAACGVEGRVPLQKPIPKTRIEPRNRPRLIFRRDRK